MACRCYSNYIFILDLTPGFNGLGKDERQILRLEDLLRPMYSKWVNDTNSSVTWGIDFYSISLLRSIVAVVNHILNETHLNETGMKQCALTMHFCKWYTFPLVYMNSRIESIERLLWLCVSPHSCVSVRICSHLLIKQYKPVLVVSELYQNIPLMKLIFRQIVDFFKCNG